MAARDRVAVSALRSALAAIGNAEAVAPRAEDLRGVAVEASPVGVGAAEVERRELSEEDVAAILRREIAERETAVGTYDAAGHAPAADRLRAEAAVLRDVLDER